MPLAQYCALSMICIDRGMISCLKCQSLLDCFQVTERAVLRELEKFMTKTHKFRVVMCETSSFSTQPTMLALT